MNKQTKDWTTRFDEQFTWDKEHEQWIENLEPNDIKQFIKQEILDLLDELMMEEKDINKVHKFFRDKVEPKKDWHRAHLGSQGNSSAYDYSGGLTNGYNQAVDELNSKLEEIKKRYEKETN